MNKFREKLTPEQRQQIVERYYGGESQMELAKEYDLHERTVGKMISGGQGRYKEVQRSTVLRARVQQAAQPPAPQEGTVQGTVREAVGTTAVQPPPCAAPAQEKDGSGI